MKHTSVKLNTPCEFINITPMNPLISKCQIKVCYVGDEPNRNKSIITKDVAREMANSLPGSPIVGFFNETSGDFEEHNRSIDIANGTVTFRDTTRPYGFVDLNAKVWFQKFLDDGQNEHEYLMTEGYIWTGQYPEAKRIIDKGNNQSMELDEKTLDAFWTKDGNGKPQFFIINEAIVSKLCVLGEECEPCFEGSQIAVNFSLASDFKEQLFTMVNEVKDLLKEGGAKVFTRYAVEIGDALWSALYSYIESTYPDGQNCYCSIYRVEGIFEEGGQKFAVLQNRTSMKYYRLNFSIGESEGFIPSDTLIEVTKSYTPAEEPQFALKDVEEFEAQYAAKKKAEEDKSGKSKDDNSDDNTDDPEDCDPEDKDCDPEDDEKKKKKGKEDFACGGKKKKSKCSLDEDDDEDEYACGGKKKKKYSLEEIPEYVELQTKYSELETKYNVLVSENESLKNDNATLTEFKNQSERKEKEEMINSFYMLSDEDKKDVIENIDTYSLNDIEAKLSIICVRNKVSFDLDENNKNHQDPTTYNLNGDNNDDDADTPAWIKAVLETAKNKN